MQNWWGKKQLIYSFPAKVVYFLFVCLFYLCITAFLFILKGARMFQFVSNDPVSPSIVTL